MQETLKPKRVMVRKQVMITAEQNARLKRLAASSGRAEGGIVREGLEKVLADADMRAAGDDWLSGLMELKGMWKDRTDLDELFAQRRKSRARRRDAMMKRMRQEDQD